jgi:ketosteroid isomerase-like protein
MVPRKEDSLMSSSGKDAIEAVRARWPVLFNAGQMDELGEHFYAEDAWALPPDTEPIKGRGEIARFLRQAYESGEVRFELGVIETVAEADLGYLVGTYVLTVNGTSVNGVTHETYRLQADGTWKCVVDMWHNSQA